MSIEIKCDRCGNLVESMWREAKDSIWFNRDGKSKVVDLCEECRDDLDIFMTGEMPKPEYKTDHFYLDLPNPTVFTLAKTGMYVTGPESGYELHVTADLHDIEQMFLTGGFPGIESIDEVILGVKCK